MSLIFILKINFIYTTEITADFTFCDTNERSIVDIKNSCKLEDSHANEIIVLNNKNTNSLYENIHIFSKAKHLFTGTAYECSMLKSSATTYQNLLLQNSLEDLDETQIIVT